MKIRVSLIIVSILLAVLGNLWGNLEAQAQIDDFTFFIPYPTDLLDDQFDIANADNNFINDDIFTTISIAVQRGDTIIYYDHWEGVDNDSGLETIITSPVQPSTQVWGDNDPTNGIPPGFSTDEINAGDVIVLQNMVVLPRDSTEFFFDGGDKLTAVGGSVAVTLAVWPETAGSLFAGAWELYPTSYWDTLYRIPVGQNLDGTGANQRPGFGIVGFNVQSVRPDTELQIDLDGNGAIDIIETITRRGGTFTQISGVMSGASIEASEPVQLHLFTGNNDPGINYEARAYTILPCRQLASDYLAPRSSDGDYWLYNSDATTPLTVTVTTSSTVTNLTIPPASTSRYPPTGPLMRPTGVRFTAIDERPFCIIAAFDETSVQDWGYPVLPIDNLTTQTFVGWGVGNTNIPPDGDQSRVYVTALTTTTLFADFDQNGTVDAQFPITPLTEVPVTDPDHDLTGAFLYTDDGARFAAVWGQDENADPAEPSIDVGTGIVPIPSLLLQKTVSPFSKDIDCTGSITLGDVIQYRLQYLNNSVRPITNIFIEDDLPPEVDYIANSTRLNDVSIPDDGEGTPFLFDEGGYNVGSLPPLETGFFSFDVVVSNLTDTIINRAEAWSDDLLLDTNTLILYTSLITATDPIYQIDISLREPTDGIITAGQTITFGLTITNTSGLTFTRFSARDTFDETYLTFRDAAPLPDVIVPGQLVWNDLTNNFGDLPSGLRIDLTLSFIVNELPTDPIDISTVAIGEGGILSDGTRLPVCSDEALVTFLPPPTPTNTPTNTPTPTETPTATASPTATPSPPPSPTPGEKGDGEDDTPTPPPPPPPSPSPVPTLTAPEPTSTVFPVSILPETGQRPPATFALWYLVVLLVLGLWLAYRHYRNASSTDQEKD